MHVYRNFRIYSSIEHIYIKFYNNASHSLLDNCLRRFQTIEIPRFTGNKPTRFWGIYTFFVSNLKLRRIAVTKLFFTRESVQSTIQWNKRGVRIWQRRLNRAGMLDILIV